MTGLIDRSPDAIDKYYKDFDEPNTLKHKEEIITRIRSTLNLIDDLLKNNFKTLAFSRPQLFYALFAVIYDLRYGLKSDLTKLTPKKLNPDILKRNILTVSKRIEDNVKIPDKVFVSFTKGTNRLNARKLVFDFLKKELLNDL